MATTPTAAANRNNLNLYTAKIHKSLILTIIASSKNPSETDPDPMDWNELDSLMSKPPQRERKPKKAAQRQYQAAVEQAGGLYYIASNFTTFVAWYHQNFGKGGQK